jgi:putative hydrolase of the HAD superfamily
MKYKTYVFDLDNTLINEIDYLFVAYSQIADYLSSKYNFLSNNSVYDFLCTEFLKSGRNNLFNNLNSKFGIDVNSDVYLEILRTCKFDKSIPIIEEIFPILYSIYKDNNKLIYILTNGNVTQQKNKIENIDWKGIDIKANVIFANAYIAKPNPIGLNIIVEDSKSSKKDTVFIGDSTTDYVCAEKAGVDFYYVKEFLNEYTIN